MKNATQWHRDPDFEKRDRFVLSKGHASAAYYSIISQLGYIEKEELLTFRKFGSRLQGHPMPVCPGVEVATGSLGQGLSIACGIAIEMCIRDSFNDEHAGIKCNNITVIIIIHIFNCCKRSFINFSACILAVE